MAGVLVSCVPNFSEGRDADKISALTAAIASAEGVWVLDCHQDPDHHRSVITFVGPPEAVLEGALRGAAKAFEVIDMNGHAGVHPRIGALDVLPFVPYSGVSLEDCARLAVRAGHELWQRHGVPVYFYGAASPHAGRAALADIRRGGFETLKELVRLNAGRQPDVGESGLHPTAGAAVVGARPWLVAYNVVLDSADVEAARAIARAVRQSTGGLPGVQALGLWLASRGLTQVSMNLTDVSATTPYDALLAVEREAAARGVEVLESELVGLAPRRALQTPPGSSLRLGHPAEHYAFEDRLEKAMRAARDRME